MYLDFVRFSGTIAFCLLLLCGNIPATAAPLVEVPGLTNEYQNPGFTEMVKSLVAAALRFESSSSDSIDAQLNNVGESWSAFEFKEQTWKSYGVSNYFGNAGEGVYKVGGSINAYITANIDSSKGVATMQLWKIEFPDNYGDKDKRTLEFSDLKLERRVSFRDGVLSFYANQPEPEILSNVVFDRLGGLSFNTHSIFKFPSHIDHFC